MTTIKEHLENIFPEYGGCGCMSCDSLDIRGLIEQAIKMIDKELIGKDQSPQLMAEKLRPEASMAEYGAFINYIRNRLRIQQRQKLQ